MLKEQGAIRLSRTLTVKISRRFLPLKLALIGFELGLFWVKLGLNWLCFFVKSPFSGEKCTKLALFCIKRGDLSNILYSCRAF